MPRGLHLATHRVPQAHGAHVGVGVGAKLGGAAAERLAVRQQLHVRLDADDGLVLRLVGHTDEQHGMAQ